LSYADHLHKSYQDWETRWENVRELITFATDVTPASDPEDGTSNIAVQELDDEGSMIITEQNNGLSTTAEATYPSVIDLTEDEEAIPDQAEVYVSNNKSNLGWCLLRVRVTPLRLFLQNTSLSTDTMVRDDESKTEVCAIGQNLYHTHAKSCRR
jgi:DNA helicase II / ATP-dependent DNA helicase PcrA